MIINSLFAFLHFVAAFAVVFTVFYEKIVFKQNLTSAETRQIQKADSIYGLAALLVLIVGFLRVFLFEKGKDYYYGNWFFWTKLGLFAMIGLLSIYPTVRFIKWKKIFPKDDNIELEAREYINIKRCLNLEVVGLVLMLVAASLMAKGVNI